MITDNRNAWEAANKHFNTLKGDYAQAIRQGVSCLPSELVSALQLRPSDILFHPFCNDGREAAFLSHAFGVKVLGVDFSNEAVQFALNLNTTLRLANRFECAEVHAWMQNASEAQFTAVMLTNGSLKWISDLTEFFSQLHRLLVLGGAIILWDFHPLVACLDSSLTVVTSYPSGSEIRPRTTGLRDYASLAKNCVLLDRIGEQEGKFERETKVTSVAHSLSAIVNALVYAGFSLISLNELSYSWEERSLPWLIPDPISSWKFVAPDSVPSIPLSVLVKCTKT